MSEGCPSLTAGQCLAGYLVGHDGLLLIRLQDPPNVIWNSYPRFSVLGQPGLVKVLDSEVLVDLIGKPTEPADQNPPEEAPRAWRRDLGIP